MLEESYARSRGKTVNDKSGENNNDGDVIPITRKSEEEAASAEPLKLVEIYAGNTMDVSENVLKRLPQEPGEIIVPTDVLDLATYKGTRVTVKRNGIFINMQEYDLAISGGALTVESPYFYEIPFFLIAEDDLDKVYNLFNLEMVMAGHYRYFVRPATRTDPYLVDIVPEKGRVRLNINTYVQIPSSSVPEPQRARFVRHVEEVLQQLRELIG